MTPRPPGPPVVPGHPLLIIDVHAHLYPEEAVTELGRYSPALELQRAPDGTRVLLWRGSVASVIPPESEDLADRLDQMDRLGIGEQILSFGAVDIGWAGEHDAEVARRLNELLADVCRAYPGRFRFLAAVPLSDPSAMLAELERALALGAVGAGLTTTVAGLPLDAPRYREFWRQASRLGLPVLIHPCYPPGGALGDAGGVLLGAFAGETSLAATRLILSGVLEECPGAQVIWSHLGGGLPMIAARLDAGYKRVPTCPRPASYYLHRCYYDAVTTHGPALDCARQTFGPGRLLFGTDEPHRLELPRDILSTIRARPWPAEELDAVLCGTATDLFRLA